MPGPDRPLWFAATRQETDYEKCISHLPLVGTPESPNTLPGVNGTRPLLAGLAGRLLHLNHFHALVPWVRIDAFQTNTAVSITGMANIPQPPEKQHLFAPSNDETSLHTNPMMQFTPLHACRPIRSGRHCKLMIPRHCRTSC